MSTTKGKEPDYEKHMKERAPNRTKRTGMEEREARRRRSVGKERITIRLDEDVLEEFKRLVPEGRGYQNLINQALREWLSARGVKELLREELPDLLLKSIAKAEGKEPVES